MNIQHSNCVRGTSSFRMSLEWDLMCTLCTNNNNINTYYDCDGFAMAGKVLCRLPTVLVPTLDDLCRRSWVVHGVCRDDVLTIGRPVQSQHVCCTTALHNAFRYCDGSPLASCLINAQPLLAHRPATDDRQMIGRCPVPRAVPVPISLKAYVHFGAHFGAFFYWTRCFENNVPFDNTTPICLRWKLGSGFRLDSELHYFSIFHGE